MLELIINETKTEENAIPLDVDEIWKRYQILAYPVNPANGEIPNRFVERLKGMKSDEEMRVFTVTFSPREDGVEDIPFRGRSGTAGVALVVSEFGEAKVVAWNKPSLTMSEHQEAFEEAALQAVERAGDD